MPDSVSGSWEFDACASAWLKPQPHVSVQLVDIAGCFSVLVVINVALFA